jgi:glycosidase
VKAITTVGLVFLLLFGACIRQEQVSVEPTAAVSGGLDITVGGLPRGARAAVTVTGPRRFQEGLGESTRLEGLQPGNYQIAAEAVTFLGEAYEPSVDPERLVVRPRQMSAANVSYSRPIPADSGELVVTVSGLSEGMEANATVMGPAGFRAEITASVILKELEAGNYTLSAFSVLNDQVWVPHGPSFTVSVELGEESFLALDYLQPTPLERPQPTDWRQEVIYFAMTDRFKNGDASNDDGALRPGAGDEGASEAENPLGWHGGDFTGITQKISEGYFQEMGFTAIWISPVYLQVPALTVNDAASPSDGERFAGYHGYWAEDFFQVDPHFGAFAEYQELVQTAREHNIRIIQDMVVNHTGYDAELTRTQPAWFHTQQDCDLAPPEERVQACPLAGLPDLDDRIPEVRDFLNATVRYWVDNFGIDGIRMDTVKHVYDEYWRQFFAPGGPGDPNVVWTVGEIFDGSPAFLAYYLDELGLPAAFDFPLYFRIKDHLSHPGGNLDDVAVIFDQDGAYHDPTRLVTFIDNHDVPLFMSEAMNRGISQDRARERLDAALSLIYTVRGTPSVYYGTELARSGRGDPYNHPPFEGNRVKMDFEAEAPLAGRLAALAEARQSYRALTHGEQSELWRPHGGPPIFAFRRTLESEAPVVAVLNNGDAAVELSTLSGGGIPLRGTFAQEAELSEITGRGHNLSVDASGHLVGTVPPRTLLAVTGEPGVPEEPGVTSVTFTVDARSQGAGEIQLRRFDMGSELRYDMAPVAGNPGFWKTTLELERFRTIVFKFGNGAQGAKNLGYEGSGQPDRSLRLDEETMSYSGAYDFITVDAPETAIEGVVGSSGTPLTRALVDSSTNPELYYAFTFADGSYYLPHPAGATDLTAQAAGYETQTLEGITAPATGVNFDLTMTATTKYVIDGDLTGWAPRATLGNPTFGRWGDDNRLLGFLVDWDDTYLYLGYEHHVEIGDNRTIIHLGTGLSGSTTGEFETGWPHLADFTEPISHFLPKYQNQDTQLWRVTGQATAEMMAGESFEAATQGTLPGPLTTEVAIPWASLGLTERPDEAVLRFYGGIFGGEGYGAGDIIPNPESTPAGPGNAVDPDASFRATFPAAFTLTIRD